MFKKKFKLIVLIFCMVLVIGCFTINTQAQSTVLLAVQGVIVNGNLVKFSGVNGIGVDAGVSAASVVTGPGSSTDHAIVRWDSTTGTAILDSVVTVSDAGAIASVTNISMTGELDLTGASAVIDLNPAATGSQKVVNLTPSATLAATSTWDGFFIDATALDPLTGGTTFIHGFHVDFSGVLSTDGDDAVCGGTYVLLPTGDTAHSYAHTHVLNEMTVAGSQSGLGSLGGALVLSFTATYRGIWIDWDNITRDANAPVLEGMRIELPANYTNFGTSFGAYFSGGGETLTICDGTYSLNLGGNMLVTATGARGIDITGATTSAQLYIGGTNILANGEQAIYVNCPSEDGATNAIWLTLGSTVVTGDLTGARIKTTSQAASGGGAASGVNVRGVYAQAIVAASKHAGLLQAGLFVADVSAGSVTAYNIHVLCGHYSAGESTVIGGDLYVGLLRSQTREDNARAVTGYDAILALENEAIQGDGGTVDAAIRIFDTNIAGSVIAFTYGIDMNGAIITSDIRLSSAHTITDSATGIAISLLSPTTISGLANVTSAAADYIMIWDATDSVLKKCDMGEVIGASLALDNLASVAINTSLFSDTQDTDSLGSTAKEWLNLYIGDAGKIFIGLSQDIELYRSGANVLTITASGGVVITAAGLTVGGTILSDTADTDDLGSVDKEWKEIFISDAGHLYLGSGQDTNLQRTAAGILTLTAANGVVTSAGFTVGGDIILGANSIGRDADNDIDFETDNRIMFRTGGVDGMEIISTGELDMNANTIGFTMQTLTGDGTDDIDWKLGNKFQFTCPAGDETFTFTAPTNPCNLILEIIQDGVGSRDITWPVAVKWLGTEPTWSDGGAAKTIVVAFWYNGTNYWAQGTPWEE